MPRGSRLSCCCFMNMFLPLNPGKCHDCRGGAQLDQLPSLVAEFLCFPKPVRTGIAHGTSEFKMCPAPGQLCIKISFCPWKKGISGLSLGPNPQNHLPVMLAPGKEFESIDGHRSYSSTCDQQTQTYNDWKSPPRSLSPNIGSGRENWAYLRFQDVSVQSLINIL